MPDYAKQLWELCELRAQGKLAEVWDGARVFLVDRNVFDNIDLGDNVADFVWWDHFVGRLMDQPVTGSKDRGPEPDNSRTANLVWDLARQKIITRDLGWFATGLPEMSGVCRGYIGAARQEVYERYCSHLAAQRVGYLLEASVAVAQAASHLSRDINNLDAECVQALQRAARAYLQFLRGGQTRPALIQASGLEDFARFSAPNTAEAQTWCRNAMRSVLHRIYEASLPQLKDLPGNESATLCAALAMVEHGVRWLIGDLMPMDDQRATTILFAQWRGNFEYGSFADLHVTRHIDNSPDTIPTKYANAFYPDPVWLGLTALDDDWLRGFALAQEEASARTRPPGRCAWRLAFPPVAQRGARLINAQESPYHSPYQRSFEFSGASGSAAACCAMVALGSSLHLDSNSAITAELQVDGSMKDVASKIAKVLGLPTGSEGGNDAALEQKAEHTLEGIRNVCHLLVRYSETWLERHAQKQQIQVHQVETLDEALAIMSGRLEKVLDFLDRLAVNGLIENVQFRPPRLAPEDIANFCLPVRIVDEDEWQRLEKERTAPKQRGPDERDYIFAQSEEFWRMEGDRRATPRFFDQVLKGNRRVVIRGEPGEGKTTALYLHVAQRCRQMAEGLRGRAFGLDSPECRIPLPLLLSKATPRRAGHPFSVIRRACQEALQLAYGLTKKVPKEVAEWLDGKIERGEIDLHLDALDELDRRWDERLRQDLERVDRSRTSEIGVVLTTRLSADDTKVMKARRYRMVCFGPAQVRDYIARYFANVENGQHLADELRNRLRLSPGPRLLAQIPLLLSLLCERKVAWPQKPLPETRTELLAFALHRMMERGDAKRWRPADDSPTERNLIKEVVLRYVAWRFFATGPLPFTKKELLPVLDGQLHRFEGEKHDQPRNASALLNELLADGLLVREEEGAYRFVLRSLHEYALAGWIARESPPMVASKANRRAFTAMIRGQGSAWERPDWPKIKPLNQPGWKYVWPLVTGQLPSSQRSWLATAVWEESRESEDLLLSRAELAASCLTEAKSKSKIGREIQAALGRALSSPSAAVWHRITCARALGYFSDEDTSKVLVQALRTATALHTRRECALSLAKIGTNGAISALIDQFTTVPSFRLRIQFAEALGKLADPAALDPLIDALEANEPGIENGLVRMTAAMALAEIGDDRACASLTRSLRNGQEPMARAATAISLGRIAGEAAIPDLVHALQSDPDWNVRGACVHVLGELAAADVVPPIAHALLNDPHMSVRRFSAEMLGNVGGPVSTEALFAAWKSESEPWVQKAITLALATMVGNHNVVPLLLNGMRESNSPYLRWSCMVALGRREPLKERALLLESLRGSSSSSVRRDCARELAAFRDVETKETLIASLTKDPDNYVRNASAIALGHIGDTVSRSALTKALSSSSEVNTVTGCAEGLGAIGDADSMKALIEGCRLSDLHGRVATMVLSSIANVKARGELAKGLEDNNEAVCFACIQGLDNILRIHGWRPLPNGAWEEPSGERIPANPTAEHRFAPDYGLMLARSGMESEARFTFLPFSMYSLATCNGVVFSTTSLILSGTERFAATLDFDRSVLEQLLTSLPHRLSQCVRSKIMELPIGPWVIMFDAPVSVEVEVKLGEAITNDAETFIPLNVTEVRADALTQYRMLEKELLEIGKQSGFMPDGKRHDRAREIGAALQQMGGLKLMQEAAERVIMALHANYGLVLGRELEWCWDGIGGWWA